MTDITAAELKARGRKLRARIADAREVGEGIDRKIERLEDAKRQVAPVDDEVSEVCRSVRRFDPDRWRGVNRDGFNAVVVDVVVRKLQAYVKGAAALHGQICDEIRRLEQERGHNGEVVARLARALKDVERQCDRLPS